MKYLSLAFLTVFLSITALSSCRETNPEKAKQDIVEDMDELLQPADEKIKEVIHPDSLNLKEINNKEEIPNT